MEGVSVTQLGELHELCNNYLYMLDDHLITQSRQRINRESFLKDLRMDGRAGGLALPAANVISYSQYHPESGCYMSCAQRWGSARHLRTSYKTLASCSFRGFLEFFYLIPH